MSWQATQPKEAIYVSAADRRALRAMLAEMSSHRLEVTLVPSERDSNSNRKVRVVMDQNAEWYQRFCSDYPSTRKRHNQAFDTKIKRIDTIEALEKMIKSEWAIGFYQTAILNYIHGFVKDQQAQRAAAKRAAYERKLEKKREARRLKRESFDPSSF